MNLDNLLNRSDVLINGMKENGYGQTRLKNLKRALQFLEKNRNNSWNDYRQALSEFVEMNKCSQSIAKDYSSIFYYLEDFDKFGLIPDHKNCHRRYRRITNYDKLNKEFKELIDFASENAKANGLKEKNFKTPRSAASSFLAAMMTRGCFSLKEITEEDVISYYLDDKENPKVGFSKAEKIRTLFRYGKEYDHFEGERVYNLLVKVKHRMKNQPVLSDQEAEKILTVLADKANGLDYRDRAMVSFLLYTGVRVSDVEGLNLGSINREDQEISIIQQKTNSPLTLPLIPQLQKVLDDYLEHQRPKSDLDFVFLSKTTKPRPIGYEAVYEAVNHVFDTANIRMHGERRGTHIFRRYFATRLLGKKVSRAEISKMLGHEAPESIEPYLGADYENIKKRALSIEAFPVDKEVIRLCLQ